MGQKGGGERDIWCLGWGLQGGLQLRMAMLVSELTWSDCNLPLQCAPTNSPHGTRRNMTHKTREQTKRTNPTKTPQHCVTETANPNDSINTVQPQQLCFVRAEMHFSTGPQSPRIGCHVLMPPFVRFNDVWKPKPQHTPAPIWLLLLSHHLAFVSVFLGFFFCELVYVQTSRTIHRGTREMLADSTSTGMSSELAAYGGPIATQEWPTGCGHHCALNNVIPAHQPGRY